MSSIHPSPSLRISLWRRPRSAGDLVARRAAGSNITTGSSSRIMAAASALTLMCPAATSQMTWTRLGLPGRESANMAYDPVTGNMLMFGGYGGTLFLTAVWDGAQWSVPQLTPQPTYRHAFAMATDIVHQHILLFGGLDTANAALGDTWEWDGVRWQSFPVTIGGPSARGGTTMVYDLVRGVMVLFGGIASGAVSAETWEWTGSSWRLRLPAHSPEARWGHAMAYDAWRGRTVLCGGVTAFGMVLADTWEWNGADWTQRAASVPRWGHSMTFDVARGRTFVFGGSNGGGIVSSVSAWDGTTWSTVVPGRQPIPRTRAAAAYDWGRGKTLYFGGSTGSGFPSFDTWTWDGATWEALGQPSQRFDASMTHDSARGSTIVFGGSTGTIGGTLTPLGDTWELRDGIWRELQPPVRPSPRGGAGFAFDAARGDCILFGGGPALAETWRWNGTTWNQLTTAVTPPGRFAACMTYDSTRREILLFGGGTNATLVLGDTWIWDGNVWTPRVLATHPSARRGATSAYDPLRHHTVVFGGVGSSQSSLSDTWLWNGTSWTLSSALASAQWGGVTSYDPARRSVFTMLGTNLGNLMPTLMEWTGNSWSNYTAANLPPRAAASATFDARRRRTLVFGGTNGHAIFGDVWEFGFANPAGSDRIGTGCSGIGGTATALDSTSSPWLGAPLGLSVSPIANGAAAQIAIGFSNTADGSQPLPLALDSLGMPGCMQYVSLDQWLPATTSGTTATAALPIPSAAGLVGLTFYCQALVADPTANALGFVVSNALACLIGSP